MLQMDKKHWEIIKEILAKYPYEFYAFGSRAKKKARKFSDFDICFKDNIPGHVLTQIRGEFEDSNLPFTVELIDWNQCDQSFQDKIKNDLILLRDMD